VAVDLQPAAALEQTLSATAWWLMVASSGCVDAYSTWQMQKSPHAGYIPSRHNVLPPAQPGGKLGTGEAVPSPSFVRRLLRLAMR